MTACDVVVVGAGVAGLAAARTLRAAGRSCEVLEALPRLGGRAHTLLVGEEAFDAGASWLHAAERNPLADLARDAGEALRDSDAEIGWLPYVDGRPATATERAARFATAERLAEAAARAAAGPSDMSFADAMAPLAGDPWLANLEMFEATLIAAADARALSVRDWAANDLDGGNLNVVGGLGAFVARRLATPVRLSTPVSRIAWRDGVTLDTPAGSLRARAAIVTVSTGVLRSEAIRFDPALPHAHLAALEGLPMGLLDKVALRPDGAERLGIPPSRGVSTRLAERHAAAMSFLAWPFGAGHVVGFVGGSTAWRLAADGAEAQREFALAQLERIVGHEAAGRVEVTHRTSWGTEPAFLGSYAYARVGHAGARAALGEPLANLVFAGEATAPDGLAGTVGGAWRSGCAAARTVMATLPR